MEIPLSIALGIGLAASAGFRIFVPLLCLSIATQTGHIELSEEFQWIGSDPALISFAVATFFEIFAYYHPWIDHILDILATPLAMFAGVLSAAAVISDAPPLFRWGIAIIAGGSVAGMVQGATVFARLKSTLFTGGLGNFVFATIELLGGILLAFLSIAAPFVAVLLIVALLFAVFRAAGRLFFIHPRPGHNTSSASPPNLT